jgi:hypothetical protein
MTNVSEKKVVEKIKMHILNAFQKLFIENHAVYEKMWNNVV